MSGLELHYVALKPIACGLANGGVHTFQPGDIIPAEEAHAWPGRAVDNLIAVSKVAPVHSAREDVDAQLEKLAAVSAAHAEANPAPVVDDLPGGKEDGEQEETSAPVLSSSEEETDGTDEPSLEPEPDPALSAENGDSGEGLDGKAFPQHVGFGVYELSDGSTVRGKDEAQEAQALLDAEPETDEPAQAEEDGAEADAGDTAANPDQADTPASQDDEPLVETNEAGEGAPAPE